jgi:OmpA-OmpF porin, OOP family
MGPTTKIIIGAIATALLAGVAHGPLGLGGNCCGKIGTAAQAAVGPGVTVTMQDNPLQRVALLSGNVTDPAARAAALAAALAVPGVASARWIDGDGAPPAVASAPDVPATAATVANCQTDVDTVIKGKKINFATARAEITGDSMPLISELAKALKDCAGTTVEVSGHTDRTGNPAANQTLSEARAQAVVAALSKDGVPKDTARPSCWMKASRQSLMPPIAGSNSRSPPPEPRLLLLPPNKKGIASCFRCGSKHSFCCWWPS